MDKLRDEIITRRVMTRGRKSRGDALSDYGAAELRDDTWVDLFPWLDEYESADAAELEVLVPNVPDWWIADSPQDTSRDVALDDLVAGLARLAVRRHRASTFGRLAPRLAADIPVAALGLGTRARTVVHRLGDPASVSALLSSTAEALFALKGTSPDTVQDVAAGVLGAAVLTAPEDRVPEGDAEDPVAVQLVDDLRVLARWRGLRGAPDSQLIAVHIEDDAPEEVQEVAARIAAISAEDFGSTAESNPVDEIENLIEQLGERETLVLQDFVMAATPITMGELSVRLHVSKSRAAGIVARLRQEMAAACEFETTAGGLLASMRARIRPVIPLESLLDAQPVLRTEVPSLGVPLWLALDRLDDGFEVSGPWAVAPDRRTAKGKTVVMLEQFESRNGVVPLTSAAETLALSPAEVREWLRYCDIPVLKDRVLLATRRLVDHAAAILEVLGGVVDIGDLAELLDTDRTEKFVSRQLADDDRFACTPTGHWTLAASGEASNEVLATPDGAPVTEGNVSHAEPPEEAIAIRPTRRLYRTGGTWRFRVRVTTEHLRGSGFTIPAGVAQAFGCRRGQIRELRSPLGIQTVRWTGTNPTCGTIRRFLVEVAAQPDDVVFLTCSADGGFDVVPCAQVTDDEPVRSALALIGVSRPGDLSEPEAAPVLAEAIGLDPDTKPRRILSRYQARDEAVAERLEAAWTVGIR